MYENAIDTIPKKYGKYYRTKNLKDLKTRSKDWWKYVKPLFNIRNTKKYWEESHIFWNERRLQKGEESRIMLSTNELYPKMGRNFAFLPGAKRMTDKWHA